MSGVPTIELRVGHEGEARVRLLSPGVGLFTDPPAFGEILVPGQRAGVLLLLGRAVELRVPAGIVGRVAVAPDERVRRPVGYEDVLLELEPIDAESGALAIAREALGGGDGGELVVRSAQPGRFYQRPAPGEATFLAAGDEIARGAPIGLLEIMKTFHRVPYSPGGVLPERARVVRYLAPDGADVDEGSPLVEVEPLG